MLEEFVTLAELSDVRKTNFSVNLMSMAVKNNFLMLADPRHASVQPQQPEPFSVHRCLGQEVCRKFRVLLSGAGEAVSSYVWLCSSQDPDARAYHLESSIIILTAEGDALYSAIAANISSPIHCPCVDAAAAVIKNIMAALADKGSV